MVACWSEPQVPTSCELPDLMGASCFNALCNSGYPVAISRNLNHGTESAIRGSVAIPDACQECELLAQSMIPGAQRSGTAYTLSNSRSTFALRPLPLVLRIAAGATQFDEQ
eukprot:6209501-Amphidinium_carterae.1